MLQRVPNAAGFCSRALIFCVWIGAVMVGKATASPAVWSGLATSFRKASFANSALPQNQDHLTANVALARGSQQGLYNAVKDLMGWNGSGNASEPTDTEWATNINNPAKTIQATNWQALSFDTWLAAYGGDHQVGLNIVDRDAVLHLVIDNVYLDIRFTSWGSGFGNGGGFSLMRAVPPAVPEPAAIVLAIVATLALRALVPRSMQV